MPSSHTSAGAVAATVSVVLGGTIERLRDFTRFHVHDARIAKTERVAQHHDFVPARRQESLMPLVESQHASVGLNLELDRREERQPPWVDWLLQGRGLVRLYIDRPLDRAASIFERDGVAAREEVVQHQRRDAALSPIDCNGRSYRGRRHAQTSRLPGRAHLLPIGRHSGAGRRRLASSDRGGALRPRREPLRALGQTSGGRHRQQQQQRRRERPPPPRWRNSLAQGRGGVPV